MQILLVLLFGFLVLAGVQTAMLVWRRRQVQARSAHEWQVRRDREDARLEGVSEDQFVSVYRRVYGPRGQVYVLGALAAAAAATPIILGLLYAVWVFGWTMSGKPRVYAPGNLVSQFYLFFGLIGCWVAIASQFAARFHRRRPHGLEQELVRVRADLP